MALVVSTGSNGYCPTLSLFSPSVSTSNTNAIGALSTFIWVSALERVISQITSLIVLGRQEYALWTVPTASSNLDESDSLKSSPRTATPLSPAL